MERLDFSAVMGVLRKHVNEDLCPNQTELVDILFSSFSDSSEAADFVYDPGQVCRWIKGQTRLSPQISSFYLKPANQKKLARTIEREILPMIADSAMALQELYDLLQQDQEISEQKKEELSQPSMVCLEEHGLVGTTDSVDQVIRYAGCAASQKDYMHGIITTGKLLLRLEDQGRQDTLDYANACESLAFCFMMMGKLDVGFGHYKKCLAVYEKLYGDDSEIVAAKKEQIQQNCAKLGFYLAKRLLGEI